MRVSQIISLQWRKFIDDFRNASMYLNLVHTRFRDLKYIYFKKIFALLIYIYCIPFFWCNDVGTKNKNNTFNWRRNIERELYFSHCGSYNDDCELLKAIIICFGAKEQIYPLFHSFICPHHFFPIRCLS